MLLGFGFNEFRQLSEEATNAVVNPNVVLEDVKGVKCIHCSWDKLFIVTRDASKGNESI